MRKNRRAILALKHLDNCKTLDSNTAGGSKLPFCYPCSSALFSQKHSFQTAQRRQTWHTNPFQYFASSQHLYLTVGCKTFGRNIHLLSTFCLVYSAVRIIQRKGNVWWQGNTDKGAKRKTTNSTCTWEDSFSEPSVWRSVPTIWPILKQIQGRYFTNTPLILCHTPFMYYLCISS